MVLVQTLFLLPWGRGEGGLISKNPSLKRWWSSLKDFKGLSLDLSDLRNPWPGFSNETLLSEC